MKPILVAVDWGTSALRAYLLGESGKILEQRDSGHGTRALPDGGFEPALRAVLAGWTVEHLPLLMSGMVGSRSGWREVPYVDGSDGGVAVPDLARALMPVDTPLVRKAWIVPGIRTSRDGLPDVMRGEETQVFGAAARPDGFFILPGTHSKWVQVTDGRIGSFRTAMTGELFAVLSRHSILGETMPGPADADEAATGFAAGLDAAGALTTPGALLQRLFSIRAAVLCGELPAGQASDFLSGLLIGAEIAALPESGPVCLVGAPALAARYARALDRVGIDHHQAPPDCVATGLYTIAAAAGLLTENTE